MTPKTKLPLSVCMIAGAEAHRIRRSLLSVADWASEMVVVVNDDTTDGTAQVAADCGAKVFLEAWKGHVAQKNSAADKATFDWRLGLDADEEVSPALRDEIMALLSAAPAELPHPAYSFPRCVFYGNRWIRHGEWYPDRKTRLWRQGRARWGGEDPHDKLIVNGTIGKLKHDLWHYSLDNLDQFVRKALGYSHTFAEQRVTTAGRVGLMALGGRPLWCFIRGYILKRGFLDGRHGFVLAKLYAYYTFLKYAKLWELQQTRPTRM